MEVINEAELEVIVNAIYTRYGLDFRNYEKESLRRRVTRIIERENLESIYGLWRKVLYEPSFIQSFVNQIAVGFTELFRNPDLWRFLRDKVLSQFTESELSVWHAGCSTGEEVYSFAITYQESRYAGNLRGLATDHNTQFLQVAEQGLYLKGILPKYEENYQAFTEKKEPLSKYYQPALNGDFRFKAFLRQDYRFERHNLTQDPAPKNLDIVFCRNVLIYFDETLRHLVLEKICQSLKPGGYLILGYYDHLSPNIKPLFETISPLHKIYRRHQ